MLLLATTLLPALPVAPVVIDQPGRFGSPLRFHEIDDVGYVRLAGDVDADGDVDLIAFKGVISTFNGFQVWLNDGDARFTLSHDFDFPFATSNQTINHPLLGDMTGDGLPDIVIDRQIPSNFNTTVYVNRGGGVFTAGTDLGHWIPQQLFADREGDGSMELVHLYADSGDLKVDWYGLDGANAWQLESSSTIANVQLARSGALDIDGDDDDDLVVYSSTAEIHILPTVGGTTTAGATDQLPPAFPASNVAVFPGDFDGANGEDFIVVAGFISGVQGVLIAPFENDGAGNLTQRPTQNVTTSFFSVSTTSGFSGDWDGDGDLDMISGGQVDPRFFENIGDFEFAFASQTESGFGFNGVGMRDLDGDGNQDYVSSVDVVFGDGTFPTKFSEQTTVPSGVPAFHLMRDWERDGDADMVAYDGYVFTNDGTGVFTNRGVLISAPPGFSFRDTAAYSDLNGDGRDDYLKEVFSGGSLATMGLVADDGLGGYEETDAVTPAFVGMPTPPEGGFWPTFDVDDDGFIDVLALDRIWLGASDGDLTEDPTAYYDGAPLLAADLAGDARLDLVTVAPATSELRLLTNVGDPGFTVQVLGSGASDESWIEAVDMDGDGDLDLAESEETGTLTVYENLGGGSFAAGAVLSTSDFFERGAIGVEDFDGDGTLELLTIVKSFAGIGQNPRIRVYGRSGAAFVWEVESEWEYRAWSTSSVPRPMRFADVDGDGDLDAMGVYLVRNLREDGPQTIRQYGTGVPGSDGAVPVLGATGPATLGSTTAALKLAHAFGGGAGILAVGTSEAALADFPLPGITTYFDIGGAFFLIPFTAGGAVGIPGAGELTVPITVNPGLVGFSFFHQVFGFDPGAAGGLSASNGLEIHYAP